MTQLTQKVLEASNALGYAKLSQAAKETVLRIASRDGNSTDISAADLEQATPAELRVLWWGLAANVDRLSNWTVPGMLRNIEHFAEYHAPPGLVEVGGMAGFVALISNLPTTLAAASLGGLSYAVSAQVQKKIDPLMDALNAVGAMLLEHPVASNRRGNLDELTVGHHINIESGSMPGDKLRRTGPFSLVRP